MRLVAPRNVGSSGTRARTRVPCIGRRIPNHCTTREALKKFLITFYNCAGIKANIIQAGFILFHLSFSS